MTRAYLTMMAMESNVISNVRKGYFEWSFLFSSLKLV